MKKLKMLTSILLVLVLCLSFMLPIATVNAADGSVDMNEANCSITISGQAAGHRFVAYRIFKADLNVVNGENTLSNIKFAHTDEEEAADLLAELNSVFKRTAENEFKIAADVADYLSDLPTDEQHAAAVEFAVAARNNMTSVESYELTSTTVGEETKYSVSNVKPGYYLIIDENVDTLEPESSIYSRFILEVAGDVEATAKIEGKPVLDKLVGKLDAGGNANYAPQENMDGKSKQNTANIGDIIPFRLEINFPELAEYNSYKFVVTDTFSEGFTFQNDVTMKIVDKVDGTETTYLNLNGPDATDNIDFVYNASAATTGNLTITFSTIFNRYKADENLVGKTIVIEYTAQLNDKAKVNQEPNTNTAKLTYSNNPRTTTEGTTPEVTTETYTYAVTINKVRLEKKDAAWGNANEVNGGGHGRHVKTEGSLSDTEFEFYRVTSEAGATEETAEKLGEYTTDANGQIELPGLENGTYYLVEKKAYDGYNKVLGKIYFTISAKYNAEAKHVQINDGDITTEIKGDAKNVSSIGVVPEFYPENEDIKFDSKGEIWLLVTNSKGVILPSTGGVGTVVFTVVGLLVMASVAVIAIKSNKKK